MTDYSDEQIEADLAALEFRRLNPGNVAGEDWTHISARLSRAVPSLYARAREAEAERDEALDKVSAIDGGFDVYRRQMDRQESRLRAELAEAKAENERLSDLVAEFRKRDESQDRVRNRLTAERDRLAAQVAAVRALAEAWPDANDLASDYTSARAQCKRAIRAALDGTEQDEAKRPVVPPPDPRMAVRPCCGDVHFGDDCDPSAGDA